MTKKTELWWASVGGNKCEPVRVGEIGGSQQFYSIGCSDPHPMDGVALIEKIEPEAIPPTPKEQKKLDREWRRAYDAQAALAYRKFE